MNLMFLYIHKAYIIVWLLSKWRLNFKGYCSIQDEFKFILIFNLDADAQINIL